MHRGGCLVVLL